MGDSMGSDAAAVGSAGGSAGQAVYSEHAWLRAEVFSIESRLEALVRGHGEPRAATVLRSLLSRFEERLAGHLTKEEESRVLERAAELEPRFAPKAEALLGEHGVIRGAVREVVHAAEGGRWPEVLQRFEGLRRTLLRHEQAENELISRALLEDVGGGD